MPELLEQGHAFLATGQMRRFAAVLAHRKAGFVQNGMGVWVVPEEQIDEMGKAMAAFRGVSHCYQRPTYPDWPYNLFSMTHGRDRGECEAVLEAISSETGPRRLHRALLDPRVQEDPRAATSPTSSLAGRTRTPGCVAAG